MNQDSNRPVSILSDMSPELKGIAIMFAGYSLAPVIGTIGVAATILIGVAPTLCKIAKLIEERKGDKEMDGQKYLNKELIESIMSKAGLKNKDNEFAEVTDIVRKEKYADVYVKLPMGLSREDLEGKLEAMQTFYRNSVTMLPEHEKDENLNGFEPSKIGYGVVRIRMYTTTLPRNVKFKVVPLSEKIDVNNPREFYDSLWFCFGQGRNGLMWCDLVKDNAFIAGEIGSGKSVLTHVILLQLISNYTPNELLIEINDFKDGIEFEEYQKLPHVSHYSCDFTKLLSYLEGIEKEMRQRIRIIKSVKGCRKLADYNCAVKEEDRLPRKVILLEEMVTILGLDKKEAGEVRRKLAVICSQARASGIHVICTTQRPSKEVIDPLIKTNINARFGLLTVDENNSKIIIDRAGCNHLKGNGHGIFKFGSYYEEFQTMYATPEIQDSLVEKVIKQYNITPIEEPKPMKALLLENQEDDLDDIYQKCL